MLVICSGNSFSLVLGLVIQYLSGEDTFSGRISSRVIISYSNIGGVVGGRRGRAHRPPRRPRVLCEHTIPLEDTTLTPRIHSFIFFHTQRCYEVNCH